MRKLQIASNIFLAVVTAAMIIDDIYQKRVYRKELKEFEERNRHFRELLAKRIIAEREV